MIMTDCLLTDFFVKKYYREQNQGLKKILGFALKLVRHTICYNKFVGENTKLV